MNEDNAAVAALNSSEDYKTINTNCLTPSIVMDGPLENLPSLGTKPPKKYAATAMTLAKY